MDGWDGATRLLIDHKRPETGIKAGPSISAVRQEIPIHGSVIGEVQGQTDVATGISQIGKGRRDILRVVDSQSAAAGEVSTQINCRAVVGVPVEHGHMDEAGIS